MSGIRTRSGVKSLTDTNLPSGTGAIAAANHREVVKSIADSATLFGEGEVIVVSMSLTSPPGSPSDRGAYVVGASATGDWSGQDDNIAIWDGSTSPGAWFFVTPSDGQAVWNLADDKQYRWDAGISPAAWSEITTGGGSIAVEDGGTSVVASATTLNFAGSGVSVADAGSGEATVTISGSSSSPTEGSLSTAGSPTSLSIDMTGFDWCDIILDGVTFGTADRPTVRFSDDGGSTDIGDYNCLRLSADAGVFNEANASPLISLLNSTSAFYGTIRVRHVSRASTPTTASGMIRDPGETRPATSFEVISGSARADDTLLVEGLGGNAFSGGTIRFIKGND